MAENPSLVESLLCTEAAKDSTKNLVSDFERQYKDNMVKKSGKKGECVVFGVAVGVLAVWLLALTVLREIQITKLRHQVDELTINMIAATANIKSLNDKIVREETIYADEDAKDFIKEVKDPSIAKIYDFTVLENASDSDDEDYDYDGGESGDYMDYDKRQTKIGTSNMQHLTSEDLGETDMIFSKEDDLSNIKALKRLLNEDPENPDIQLSVLSKKTPTSDVSRDKRSVFPDSAVDGIEQLPSPRFVAKHEERKKGKKFMPSLEASASAKLALHTVTRTVRSDEGQRRPFIAAHFHGNTSHLSPDIHENYKGNGLIKLAHDSPHDVWYPAPWTIASPHPRPTLTRNGHVHVHHTGVYLVYVQIYYLDSHDIISWVLHRTNADIEGRETLLQCTQSSHSVERLDKPNSCFSAAALFLKAGDRLAVRNTGGDRHSLMQPEKSFIGLIKLADAEDPEPEF